MESRHVWDRGTRELIEYVYHQEVDIPNYDYRYFQQNL